MQAGWRVENRRELLSFLVRLTHTLGSAAPHNYINGTSLRMLILPLTQFGLGAIDPSSPRLRGLAHDSRASTSPRRDAPQLEVGPW